MENQHRKITGYRELSQEDIDLMNEVKQLGVTAESIITKIQNHVMKQYADDANDERMYNADPLEWLERGTHELQTALMKITRAIAQPTTF